MSRSAGPRGVQGQACARGRQVKVIHIFYLVCKWLCACTVSVCACTVSVCACAVCVVLGCADACAAAVPVHSADHDSPASAKMICTRPQHSDGQMGEQAAYIVDKHTRLKKRRLSRGTIVNRTYGSNKNLYIYLTTFTNNVWSY